MMQVNSKITLEAPQDNRGPLSSSTQGESSFSSVLEAKTAAPLRQSSTVNPSQSAKPASASASGHVRAETRGKSQSEVQRSASTPSRTAATTTEKTPPSEASNKESANHAEPTERADKSEKMGLKNEVRLSVNSGDEPAAGDDATPAPDTERLLPTLMATDVTAEAGKASDDATTTAVESKDTATKTDDASAVVSDATAIDFLQHLQNSLATTTQVVIPKTHQLEGSEFISSAEISTTKPSVQKQISDAMSDEGRLDGGNLLPPLAAGRESAASAAVSASKNSELPLSKSGEKDALQLDEPILPVEPDALALPLAEPKLQVSSGLTAADAAHSAVQSSSQEPKPGLVVQPLASKALPDESMTIAPLPEREEGDRSPELAQLAALLVADSKREGASRATQTISETATAASALSPLEPEANVAFSLNHLLSPQTAHMSAEDTSRNEGNLLGKLQPESSHPAAASATPELNVVLTTQGATNQEMLSRSRETPASLAAVHLGLPQQAAPELAERMTLMIGQKWHEAEIQLEPQGLGKMSIQLSVDQEQKAHVQFIVQHGSSRDLLEQALPKLRDMLASQGIQLGQTSVQQQSAGQQQAQGQFAQQNQGQGNGSSSPWLRGENRLSESVDVQNLSIRSTGAAGIDFYA
jgi:flagellar hook-length control protein FliK